MRGIHNPDDRCDCRSIWVAAVRLFIDDQFDAATALLSEAQAICLVVAGIQFAGAVTETLNLAKPGLGDRELADLGLSIARRQAS